MDKSNFPLISREAYIIIRQMMIESNFFCQINSDESNQYIIIRGHYHRRNLLGIIERSIGKSLRFSIKLEDLEDLPEMIDQQWDPDTPGADKLPPRN